MDRIASAVKLLLPNSKFDALGVGLIDFKAGTYQVIEASTLGGTLALKSEPSLYFDLASLTKPLSNSLGYFLQPGDFSPEALLCLSHRGGLPAWGLLPNPGWREQILGYPVRETATLYSDFSALRVMLELEKRGVDLKKICAVVWDKETLHWLDLPNHYPTVQCGYKESRPNFGRPHDPNAWVIREFCTHAGLFSTTDGLCRTLLNYQSKTDFIPKVMADLKAHSHRFALGWDRVENPAATLAGTGCGKWTFGHLGFTGTSIWIDPEKMRGHVILSNAVKKHWWDKDGLNELRRAVGELAWQEK